MLDEKVPAAHAVHTRSLVLPPSAEMYWPGLHVDFEVHDNPPERDE